LSPKLLPGFVVSVTTRFSREASAEYFDKPPPRQPQMRFRRFFHQRQQAIFICHYQLSTSSPP